MMWVILAFIGGIWIGAGAIVFALIFARRASYDIDHDPY